MSPGFSFEKKLVENLRQGTGTFEQSEAEDFVVVKSLFVTPWNAAC